MWKCWTRHFIIVLCLILKTTLAGKGKDDSSTKTCRSDRDSNYYSWKWWMTSGWWKKYYGADVHFNANDRITCNIPKQSYVVFTPKHHLFATSSTTVAHSWGFGNTAVIREEDWSTGPSRFRSFFCEEMCWVQPAYYAEGRSDAIKRAKEDVERFNGENVHYNLYTCNWVRNWMYNSKYSRQSSRWASKECPLN